MQNLYLEEFLKKYGVTRKDIYRSKSLINSIITYLETTKQSFPVSSTLDTLIRQECALMGIKPVRDLEDMKKDVIPEVGIELSLDAFIYKYNFINNQDIAWLEFLYENYMANPKPIFITPNIHSQIINELEAKYTRHSIIRSLDFNLYP